MPFPASAAPAPPASALLLPHCGSARDHGRGLGAAIPAVIFYNHFLQKIRDLAQRLDTFALEFTAQVEKTFD